MLICLKSNIKILETKPTGYCFTCEMEPTKSEKLQYTEFRK